MIEVIQQDRDAAGALARFLGESEVQVSRFIAGELDHTDIAQAFAAHRQQAEDVMREQCAVIAEDYADHYLGGADGIATTIRATQARPAEQRG